MLEIMEQHCNVKILRSTEADVLIEQLGYLIKDRKSMDLLKQRFPDDVIGKYLSISYHRDGIHITENWGSHDTLAIIQKVSQ